jgi:transcriptional regulator with XRE-family HTH domain
VDVSEIIQPRHYAAREAALRQRRPGAIIDEAERLDAASNQFVAVWVPDLQPTGIVKMGGLVAVFSGGMTAAARCAPVQTSWSTTALEDFDDLLPTAAGPTWTQWAESTRKAFLEAATKAAAKSATPQAVEAQDPQAEAKRRVQRLVAIQAALGLTMQDLATALNLSRPQLYKWLEPSQDVRLQEAKRQRLDTIERVAKAWQARSAAPLRAVAHEPLANGRTAFELLAADAIDEVAVNAAFSELTAKLQAQPKTRSQLLAEAGFKRRPSIHSLPSDE